MNQSDVEAKVLLEIPNIQMHRLTNKVRNPFSSGILRLCELEKANKDKVYFINLNSFYYTINKDTIFIKVAYKKNTSYVYPHFESGLTSLTVGNDQPNLGKLEEILANTAIVVSYNQAMENPVLSDKIIEHCPDLKENQIVVSDKLQHAISVGGQYAEVGFKWLGGVLGTGIDMLGGYFGNKVEPTGPTAQSEKTKTTWNDIKNGTGKFFTVSSQYISAVLDPVVAKGKEVVGNIGEKIDQSPNENVKYLKEISETTAGAVRHAFNGVVQAATQVGTSVSNTTKDLWEKKYGEEINMNAPLSAGGPPIEKSDNLHENIEIQQPLHVKLDTKDSQQQPLLPKPTEDIQVEKPLYPSIHPGPTMK